MCFSNCPCPSLFVRPYAASVFSVSSISSFTCLFSLFCLFSLHLPDWASISTVEVFTAPSPAVIFIVFISVAIFSDRSIDYCEEFPKNSAYPGRSKKTTFFFSFCSDSLCPEDWARILTWFGIELFEGKLLSTTIREFVAKTACDVNTCQTTFENGSWAQWLRDGGWEEKADRGKCCLVLTYGSSRVISFFF